MSDILPDAFNALDWSALDAPVITVGSPLSFSPEKDDERDAEIKRLKAEVEMLRDIDVEAADGR